MTREEILSVLASALRTATPPFDKPTCDDWAALAKKFDCTFDEDFTAFTEELCNFSFPGDVLNVARAGRTNGNDTIEMTYDYEIKNGGWQTSMVPFYSIGNGDYFCFDSKEGNSSAVYYFYHEVPESKKYCESFGDWIKGLPEFLK